MDAEKAAKAAERMRKGAFDLNDLADQLAQMQKMGGMSSLVGMLPGIGKVKKQIDALGIDDSILKHQTAIIYSMTGAERKNPDLIKASRKKRIAAGSGTRVEEVNKLLKMHRQMSDMMKQARTGKGMFARMGGMLGMGGSAGAPPIDPAALERMAKSGQLPGGPTGAPGAPGLLPGLGMPRRPGLGGGGLPPIPGLTKKK
jgi:signal recognition particle subunit SRP54